MYAILTIVLGGLAVQPVLENATIEVGGVPAIHVGVYDTEDPIAVGHQTVCVIEARNEGSADLTNVVLKVTLTEELVFVSAVGPAEWKHKSGVVTFAALPPIKPGEKVRFRVVARGIKAGGGTFTSEIRYTEFPRSIIMTEATTIY